MSKPFYRAKPRHQKSKKKRKLFGWSSPAAHTTATERQRERVEEDAAEEPEDGLFYEDEDELEPDDQVDAVIQLGSGDTPLHVDLDRLLKTRLLVVANSGGGKSYLLRQIAEKAARFTTVIVIDVEGEYASLRECSTLRDVLIIGDPEDRADVAIDTRVAGALGAKLVAERQSAVVDVSSLTKNAQRYFVADFLNAMIELPKDLRSSTMIVIDEVHVFCPVRGTWPSKAAISDLMSRGRKRGLCGVIATQRIAKTHNDTIAEATGLIIGRTVDKNDLARAADILELTKGGSRTLAALKPGEFWCMGGAFSEAFDEKNEPDSYKFKAGRPRSSHPETGRNQNRRIRHTRPSDATREIIPEYEALEPDADDDLDDLGKAELIKRIRELEYQVDGVRLECPNCGHDPDNTEGIPQYRNTIELPSADDDEDLSGTEYEDDEEEDDDGLFLVPPDHPARSQAPIIVCTICGQLHIECTCDSTCADCEEPLANCTCEAEGEVEEEVEEEFEEEPCEDCGAPDIESCQCVCECGERFLSCECEIPKDEVE